MPEAGTRRTSNKSGRGDTRNIQSLNYFSIVVIRFMPKATYRKKSLLGDLQFPRGQSPWPSWWGAGLLAGRHDTVRVHESLRHNHILVSGCLAQPSGSTNICSNEWAEGASPTKVSGAHPDNFSLWLYFSVSVYGRLCIAILFTLLPGPFSVVLQSV